jgi:hypothetical protein
MFFSCASPSRRDRNRSVPQLERMEPRELLAVTVDVNFDNSLEGGGAPPPLRTDQDQ